MKLLKYFICMPFILTACTMTPEECAPSSDPGFFNKIGCSVSGSYSKRVETKQQEIKDLREEQKALTQEVINLQEKRSVLIKDRFERLHALDELQTKLDQMQSSLAAKNALSKRLQQKLDNVKKSKTEAASMPESTSVIEKKAKLAQLQKDADDLMDALANESGM